MLVHEFPKIIAVFQMLLNKIPKLVTGTRLQMLVNKIPTVVVIFQMPNKILILITCLQMLVNDILRLIAVFQMLVDKLPTVSFLF